MKAQLAAALVLLLSGCAYQLGSVNTKPGDTLRDTQIDVLTCKDAAMVHGGADAAGWIPFAGYEIEKHIRREEFKNCLLAKGYPSVIPPQ
jgi:hypothetical protein